MISPRPVPFAVAQPAPTAPPPEVGNSLPRYEQACGDVRHSPSRKSCAPRSGRRAHWAFQALLLTVALAGCADRPAPPTAVPVQSPAGAVPWSWVAVAGDITPAAPPELLSAIERGDLDVTYRLILLEGEAARQRRMFIPGTTSNLADASLPGQLGKPAPSSGF